MYKDSTALYWEHKNIPHTAVKTYILLNFQYIKRMQFNILIGPILSVHVRLGSLCLHIILFELGQLTMLIHAVIAIDMKHKYDYRTQFRQCSSNKLDMFF